jgi:hypothetical protein
MQDDQEEFKDYVDSGFQLSLTADGSPTLTQVGLEEEMHSRGGALSESNYIYKQASELFFRNIDSERPFEVCSIGLGLGYNEILSASVVAKNVKTHSRYQIRSYEKEGVLVDLFKKRIKAPHLYPRYWSLFKIDDQGSVISLLVDHLVHAGPFGRGSLKDIKKTPRLILFDAYSNKTSEELWSQPFLEDFLGKSGDGSVFATYASTGALNRALKNSNYRNLKKKGFLNKRESTLAIKE